MEEILIFGSSGHAKVVIDAVEKQGTYRIAGLVDSGKGRGEQVLGYPVLGGEPQLPAILRTVPVVGGIVAVGDNWSRAEQVQRILALVPEFKFISVIHPSSQIAHGVIIGEGTVVLAGAILNTDTQVGRHCIISTKASLDHDGFVGDYSFVAPGATTGGNVRLGDFSVLALGAGAIHGIRIGEHTVVGAGSMVLDDLPSCVVAYGVPARVRRNRTPGEKYL